MHISRFARIVTLYILFVLAFSTLSGCGQDAKQNKPGSQTQNNSGAPTIVTNVSVSGAVTVVPGMVTDSDVNDPDAEYRSNDTLSTAQNIPNPTTLGGYVNATGTGVSGRSFNAGDTDDYYQLQLLAGQAISFTATDFDLTTTPANQLILYLIDQSQNVVLATSGKQPTEILNIQSDGIYYLRVLAMSGASRYIITVGLSNQLQINSNVSSIDQADFVPGEVIVQFKQSKTSTSINPTITSATAISALATSSGLAYKAGAPGRPMLMGLVSAGATSQGTLSILGVRTKHKAVNPLLQQKLDTIEVVKALRKRSDVVSARLNYIRRLTALEPNDTYYFPRQWHYPAIKLPDAWDAWGRITGKNDPIVAVIDTGVLLNHPDLQGQLVAGYDFIRNSNYSNDNDGIDPNPDDPGDDLNGKSSFHGTHVSGTIAALTNNGSGVAGVAWNAKIMPLRVLGLNGGTDYDIEQAIRYAARLANDSKTLPPKKADVINLSLGGITNSTTAPEAFQLARKAGVIIVAAAGNSSSSSLSYPASLDGVVSVSATNSSQALAYYSNYGSTIDVAAPGGTYTDDNKDGYIDAVYSTLGSDASGSIQLGYGFEAGTSMASPHVAGVVALMKSVDSSLTPDQFDQLLSAGQLTDFLPGQTAWSSKFGYGQIDAFKAVNTALSLVNGTSPPPPAVADVLPKALNFGPVTTTLNINITKSGTGDLNITQVSNDSGGWLTVNPTSVDANGLGQYSVQVNRSILPQTTQTYLANISVATSNNSLTIPVLMDIYVENINNNNLHQYVVLQDSSTRKTIQKVVATKVNGEYQYNFEKVLPGSYFIYAGTDMDNDGIICELAEACGSYVSLGSVVPIIVDINSSALTNINIETSIDTTSSNGNVTLSKRQKLPDNIGFVPVQ